MIKGKYGAVSGVVCVLHSCGKELILNLTVYVLFTEGGLTRWVSGFLFLFWSIIL
jgi:hypothetical protein